MMILPSELNPEDLGVYPDRCYRGRKHEGEGAVTHKIDIDGLSFPRSSHDALHILGYGFNLLIRGGRGIWLTAGGLFLLQLLGAEG